MGYKVTRNGAGNYTVSAKIDGEKVSVTVLSCNEWPGPDKWQARADWDRFWHTDPLRTKKEAVGEAISMLDRYLNRDGHLDL